MNIDPPSGSLAIKPRCALALMAKVPFAGPIKTRLTPPLSPEEAATLSTCFLRDMTTNLLGMNSDGTEGVVLYTPADAEAFLHSLLPDGCKLVAQRGETLGERLINAAAELLSNGFESVCLINSDSPTLPVEVLRTATSLLAQDGDRVVLPSDPGELEFLHRRRVAGAVGDREPEQVSVRGGCRVAVRRPDAREHSPRVARRAGRRLGAPES